MEAWGGALYGDPCRECGFDWSISPADAVRLVAGVPALAWSAGAYVCHVADNLRTWAERLAGAALGGDREVSGYNENLLAQARGYAAVPLSGALWSQEHAVRDWQAAVQLGFRQDVVLSHAGRGEQTAADVARNNAHDADHHAWDIRRSAPDALDPRLADGVGADPRVPCRRHRPADRNHRTRSSLT